MEKSYQISTVLIEIETHDQELWLIILELIYQYIGIVPLF